MYDALSEKAEAVTYSTSEVATGDTWTDGKPVYRKCIVKSSTWSSGATVTLDSTLKTSYISTLISVKAVFYDSGSSWMPIAGANPSALSNQSEWYMTSSGLFAGFGSSRSPRKIICIVEYTKA